jgi:hypothetical protein
VADPRKVRWLPDAEEKDYAAAASYLSLLLAPKELEGVIERLRAAPYGNWRAKDILRATGLVLLGARQSEEVAEKLAKIAAKEALSPILMVVVHAERPTQIADGYHRVCAAYLTHEDAMVPGRILFA